MITIPKETSHQDKQPSSRVISKSRLARTLVYLIIIGLGLHFLLPQISSLKESVAVIRSMSAWLIGLACLAQIGSYLGNGYLIKSIVELGKTGLSLGRGVLIAVAAESVGMSGAGWVGAGAATYRWVEKGKGPEEEADLARRPYPFSAETGEDTSKAAILSGILPPFFNEIMLVLVTIVGLGFLLVDYHLSQSQIIFYSLLLTFVVLTLLVWFFAMKHQSTVGPLVLRVVDRVMHLLRRSYDPSVVRKSIDNLYQSLDLLNNKGWVQPAIGSALNVAFDMLCLYFIFIAAGYQIHVGVLLAGYGLAYLAGKIAYTVPGGVGVIEGSMAAIYSGLGVPHSISVVVVLCYRLFSFWIPVILGFGAMGYLEKTTIASSRSSTLVSNQDGTQVSADGA